MLNILLLSRLNLLFLRASELLCVLTRNLLTNCLFNKYVYVCAEERIYCLHKQKKIVFRLEKKRTRTPARETIPETMKKAT